MKFLLIAIRYCFRSFLGALASVAANAFLDLNQSFFGCIQDLVLNMMIALVFRLRLNRCFDGKICFLKNVFSN